LSWLSTKTNGVLVFHGIGAAGLLALVSGIALMARFGVSLHNRIDFGASLEPDDRRITPDLVRQHQNDVFGRTGLFLTALGSVLLAGDLCWLACNL
jgi:hypothetical protein